MATVKTQLHGKRNSNRPIPFALRVMRFLFAFFGRVFPRLFGRWAFFLWFRTRRFPESTAGKRAAREAVREILSVNNVPVAVYRWGTGSQTVLFVHGWSGHGSQAAAFLQPLLDAGFQVIAVDLPGHGETPGKSTNILECAAVIRELEGRFGPLHAAITHSFGGMVMALAAREGVALRRFAMIAAPSDVEFLVESFASTLSMPDAVVDDLWRRLELRFDDDFSEHIATVNNVAALDIPGLVVHDSDDASVPLTQGQRIAATWPNARFLKTEKLGHGRILRDASVIASVVGFLQGNG